MNQPQSIDIRYKHPVAQITENEVALLETILPDIILIMLELQNKLEADLEIK